jgi:rhodanese-related sulfurtransferase
MTKTNGHSVGAGTRLSPAERAAYYRAKMDAEWGPFDLKSALDKKDNSVIVLDTRGAEAFAEAHLPGAINIPTDELPQRLGELDKNKDIVPYCWSVVCHLATRASLYLSEQGYTVHELAGGIEYWKDYEMPVESAAQTASR